MSQEIFNDELDLGVLYHGIDRFSDDLPTETVENLLTGLKAIQQGDPDAARDLVAQFQENKNLDRMYTRSLQYLRRNYNTKERTKSLTMAINLPAEYDFSALGNVIDQIENLLRNRRAIELDTLQTKILKTLEKSFLTLEDISYTLGKPLSITQDIVTDLWQKGYIDYLNSSTIYILFPGLRNRQHRKSPVKTSEFLTLTRRGYFSLYPLFRKLA